jgi:hypothetical protein
VGGLTAGFLVTLAFLGVAGWLINGDHEWSGTVLGSVRFSQRIRAEAFR